jgi:hypothetical protein
MYNTIALLSKPEVAFDGEWEGSPKLVVRVCQLLVHVFSPLLSTFLSIAMLSSFPGLVFVVGYTPGVSIISGAEKI